MPPAFLLEHLPAAIHAGFQVDVVRTAQFAGILVLDIGRGLQRVGRTAHAAPSDGDVFLFGTAMGRSPLLKLVVFGMAGL